jgi:hypothetical protein
MANVNFFLRIGKVGEAFLHAHSNSKYGTPGLSVEDCEELLVLLKKRVLRKCGDPIPPFKKITLFRGVSGEEPMRRTRGISWTSDISRAARFALSGRDRGFSHDPAIYRTVVTRNEVFVYLNESFRDEEEYLIIPKGIEQLKYSLLELEQLASQRPT